MKYRPEHHLDRLRMMILDDNSSGLVRPEPLLRFRWLRSMVVDLSRTPEERRQEEAYHRLALQQHSGCPVERVACKHLNKDHLSLLLLPFLTQSVPLLTSLDLRGCYLMFQDFVTDTFLLAVADVHRKSLRRLYLPMGCGIAQSTLDRFTQLEELDACGCDNLTTVAFCSATLCVLYANECDNLTDEGLRDATKLEVLHIRNCSFITDVSPFEHCLVELGASGCFGICSASLANCRRLQVFDGANNDNMTTLQPFAQRLRELDAGLNNALDDDALADATGLVKLVLCENDTITTVEPFGASLRELYANCSRCMDDAGLRSATKLVCLSVSCNTEIRSLAPFSSSLLELQLFESSIDDDALSVATRLIWLDVHQRISTIPSSCTRTLRHLVSNGERSALTNEALCQTTQLVALDCVGNRHLTTIEPFRHCLEQLATDSEAQCLEVERAPNLYRIEGNLGQVSLTSLNKIGFCCVRKLGPHSLLFREN